MATPVRTWWRGHAGIGDAIEDLVLLGFLWRLCDLLNRETWERGRSEADVAKRSEFHPRLLLHLAGTNDRRAARRLARRVQKVTAEVPEVGPVEFTFSARRWSVSWPNWAELQKRHARQAPDGPPQSRADKSKSDKSRAGAAVEGGQEAEQIEAQARAYAEQHRPDVAAAWEAFWSNFETKRTARLTLALAKRWIDAEHTHLGTPPAEKARKAIAAVNRTLADTGWPPLTPDEEQRVRDGAGSQAIIDARRASSRANSEHVPNSRGRDGARREPQAAAKVVDLADRVAGKLP